jgi:hypothetical protein
VHYGPAGNDLYYFAALGRNGAARAGTFDEAQARIVRTDYQAEFKGEDWPWAVKGLVNEPPFSDRQVRWGPALVVKVERRPKSLLIRYIDGWLPADRTWSTGKFETNLAGNQIWFEEHTPATAETAASAGTAAKPPTAGTAAKPPPAASSAATAKK